MYGTIIGDLAGSIYEFDQTKGIKPVKMNKVIEDNAFFSDDSIETIAILDAVLSSKSYEEALKEYYFKFKDYKPDFKPYFKYPFSPGFIKWVKGNSTGTSIGNGALMRVSPIPMLIDDRNEMFMHVNQATSTSHNSKEALNAASNLANIIYMAREGWSKYDILEWNGFNLDYQPFEKFNTTCDETLQNCITQALKASSFEDAMERTLYMGGDTDTNCAIVGSMAESLYGIPDYLIEEANKKIPKEFVKTLSKGYKRINH